MSAKPANPAASLAAEVARQDREAKKLASEARRASKDAARTYLAIVLEDLIERSHAAAVDGNTYAFDSCVRAIKQYAALVGCEAPKQLEVAGKDGGPVEINALHADLLSRVSRIATSIAAGAGNKKPDGKGS